MLRRAVVLVVLTVAIAPNAAASAPPPVPLASIPALGLGSGSGRPASLFRPTTFRQSFRVPPSEGTLSVISGWFTVEMEVLVVGPGAARRTLVATDGLPGRTLGVRLPVDAWRADRIEVAGTAVSAAASASLVPAEAFGEIAWRDWWRIAAFGAFAALAFCIAFAAVRLRNAALAAPAVLAAANAALLVPWLGVVRFSPAVSQPLHALEAIAIVAALYAAVLVVAGGALGRPARRALAALAVAQAVVLLGADLMQDLWPMNGVQATLLELVVALAFVAAAIVALRVRAAGAAPLVWATSLGTAATVAAVAAPEGSAFAAVAPVLAALAETAALALAVGGGARRAIAAAPERTQRPAFGDPSFDPLTQLPNGRALDEALRGAWENAHRDDVSLAVLVVDLDRFARYNAAAGHRAGDDALRLTGAAIARAVRPADGFVARTGGDVFAALLPHATRDVARSVGEDVVAAVAAMAIDHPAASARVLTASAGVASLAPARDGGTPSQLLLRAGAALAIAKALGRNRVVLEEPDVQPSVSRA